MVGSAATKNLMARVVTTRFSQGAAQMAANRSLRLPTYRLHKPSGQARVRWMGKELWFGEFDSPASRQRFAEFLKKVVSGTLLDVDLLPRRASRVMQSADAGISVIELCVAFLRHAEQHYRKGDDLTAEYDCFVSAIKPLKELFGVIPVNEFGPCSVKAVRQKMVENGWCRRYVNRSVTRIRQIFKFGVENELVEPAVL